MTSEEKQYGLDGREIMNWFTCGICHRRIPGYNYEKETWKGECGVCHWPADMDFSKIEEQQHVWLVKQYRRKESIGAKSFYTWKSLCTNCGRRHTAGWHKDVLRLMNNDKTRCDAVNHILARVLEATL